MATAIAAIGHNSPPAIESHRLHIEELMEAAQQFLDGEPVSTQGQADDVGKLLGQLREARKGADAQRAVEKKPHDDAGKAVQAIWKPLIDRVDTAEQVAKRALAPFLQAEEDRKRVVAEEARREAETKAAAAREAIRAAQETDLAAREAAELLVKDAEAAAKVANRAEKSKAMAAGVGRSVGLVSVWHATVDDYGKLLAHYKMSHPERIKDWLDAEAQRDVQAGVRTLAGVTISEERIAR